MENENKKRRSLFSRLTFSTAALIVSLLLLMTKVKETKDVDLDNITADTYR